MSMDWVKFPSLVQVAHSQPDHTSTTEKKGTRLLAFPFLFILSQFVLRGLQDFLRLDNHLTLIIDCQQRRLTGSNLTSQQGIR
jgi:hypothetical protein